MSNSESDFTLEDGVLKLKGKARFACWSVKGSPINSAKGRRKGPELKAWKERRKDWMSHVACTVKAERGEAPWVPEDRYAVTLRFRFFRHPNQKLDVDNFVKPVLDALAAGLFLPEDTDPAAVWPFDKHHDVDDSNFRTLLIHRLPDAESRTEEGVRLFVSSTGA